MKPETDKTRILRLHKTWADGYTLLWLLLIIVLFAAIHFLLEQVGAEAAERVGALVLLSAIVIAAAIWQAVGLGVARIHMLLEGIDPDLPGRRRRERPRNGA